MFDNVCSLQVGGGSPCSHLVGFYGHIISDPAFFCRFEFDQFVTDFESSNGSKIELRQSDSDKGDTCHYDIVNLKDSLSEKVCKKYYTPAYIKVCCNGEEKTITPTDFLELDKYRCA